MVLRKAQSSYQVLVTGAIYVKAQNSASCGMSTSSLLPPASDLPQISKACLEPKPLTRFKTLHLKLRLYIGRKLYEPLGHNVYRVSRSRLIKGPVTSVGVEAIDYVGRNTTIPIQTVYAVYGSGDELYMDMEYVKGQAVSEIWRETTPCLEQKRTIAHELAGYIEQLRSLKALHEMTVASPNLGGILDCRIANLRFGPFDSHESFHSFLRGGIPLEDCTEPLDEIVIQCHTRKYRSCFTHADLAPRNIIVRDGHIAAIIDWQFGGWYPEYWEYTKAHYGLYPYQDWYALLKAHVQNYDDELKAERNLWEWLDEPGMAYHYEGEPPKPFQLIGTKPPFSG